MKKSSLQSSVIIPNWNGLEMLKICLPSLKKQTYQNFEIIVIDNGSSDGSVEYIKKSFPEVIIIKLSYNSGFAPAVNMGIKRARGEYIILINNDTRVDSKCLETLAGAAKEHPETGMIAAKMLNYYNPDKIDSAGDYIDSVGHADNIGRGQLDGEEFNTAKEVFLVTGGGSLYRRSVFDKVGLLDEDYFAYFEDVDLGLRAQLAGIKAWYQPSAVIYHVHKATSNRNKPLTEYLQFRNMTMTIIKDFPSALLKYRFNWLRILLVNVNTVRYLAGLGYLKAALAAEWYILSHLMTLLQKRAVIQKQTKVDDQYFIDNIVPKKITLFGLFPKGI